MFARTVAAAGLAFLAGVGVMLWIVQDAPAPDAGVSSPAGEATPVALPPPQDPQGEIAAERRSVIVEAVERVAPSVASVVVRGSRRVVASPFSRDFFDFFGAPFRYYDQPFTVQSGSAVIVSEEGEVITNEHVVAGGDEYFLLLPDGRVVEAELVGASSGLDLAMLRVDPDGLRPAPMGHSEDLFVGEWSVAIGYPVGGATVTSASRYQPTVTVGVISATKRSFAPPPARMARRGGTTHYYADMIQTDAAINPGNSGGPLVNAAGEVVGINTFILSESGGSQGLGFAIPVERALRAAQEFREYGRVRQASIGSIRAQPVTETLAEALDLPSVRGLVISSVQGAAARAGLQPEDVLLEVDGNTILSVEEAQLALLPRFVGDVVTLTVWRDGAEIEITMELEEEPQR